MDHIEERARKTPVSIQTDVLVAGGGFAGASAALAAARMGKKVTLLEREFMLGGLGTLGLVTIYLPLCDGDGTQVSFGIAEELFHLSIKRGVQGKYPKPWLENGTREEKRKTRFEVQYNPWLFAADLEQLLVAEGVQILYGSAVCDVITENDRISALIIENKSGRSAVTAQSFVDATGDADLCHLAGAETAAYAPKNLLANWYYFISQSKLKLKMLGCSDVSDDPEQTLAASRYLGLDAAEISDKLIEGRSFMMQHILKYRAETDPAMEPVATPTIPQLRMTRRLVGATTLDDSPRVYRADSIGCFGNWHKRKDTPAYEVPFTALYGKIKNLITAGRCISVTDEMWDFTRVIPVCAVTGEPSSFFM